MAWSMGLMGATWVSPVVSDFQLIASATTTVANTPIVFDNLGQYVGTFKHLQARITRKTTGSQGWYALYFNNINDATNQYYRHSFGIDNGTLINQNSGYPQILTSIGGNSWDNEIVNFNNIFDSGQYPIVDSWGWGMSSQRFHIRGSGILPQTGIAVTSITFVGGFDLNSTISLYGLT